jgi:glycosyltransferase involved in cell wall biosynthesis
VHHGIDLAKLAKFYEIPDENLLLADPHRIINGQYTPKVMNELYNAADVFLLPSAGEGFGVPAIEAQSAGCPVILSDFTAQSELVAPGGWRIAIDEDDKVYSPMGSHWARPQPSRIASALLEALCDKNPQRRADARKFAVEGYDAEMVYQRYMLPALEGIAGINAGERSA